MSYEVYSQDVDIMHEVLYLSRYTAIFLPTDGPDITDQMIQGERVKYVLHFHSKNIYSEYNRLEEQENLNLFIEEMKLKYEI
jgi:hypothetical protein